jgi:UDP-GlcNAc:undecaprenyl-phosphate GlcNAc-1-phosphate transferase
MDGQLASLALVSNFFLFILSYRQDQFLIAALAITISGASFAFLFWNWNPASIYLGDSGSLFLGVLMATSLLQYEPAFESFWVNLSVPIFLVAIPLIDISVATLSRILQKRSVLQGGHDHLSHILFRKFKSKSMSVLFLVLLQFAFCSIAFLVEISTGEFAEIISRIGLLGLFSITIFFLAVSKPEVSSHK